MLGYSADPTVASRAPFSHGHHIVPWSPHRPMVTTSPHGHHIAPWSPHRPMVTTSSHGHHIVPWSPRSSLTALQLCVGGSWLYSHHYTVSCADKPWRWSPPSESQLSTIGVSRLIHRSDCPIGLAKKKSDADSHSVLNCMPQYTNTERAGLRTSGM